MKALTFDLGTSLVRRSSKSGVAGAEWIVVDDSADGVVSTQTRTRVNALLLRPAGLFLGTVGVVHTLRPTGRVWIALREARAALARCNSVVVVILLGGALRVTLTRGWVARVGLHWLSGRLGDRDRRACREGITLVSLWAVAHGHVILYAALGTEAAHATARVDALVAVTGLGPYAIGVYHTLRIAALIRVAEMLRYATADADSVVHAAKGVRATFSRVAWILLHNWRRSCCWNKACISHVLRRYVM